MAWEITGTAGESPDRARLLTCINTGTSSSPTWSVMGFHVADSSIEYDNSTESNTDILGNTYITGRTASLTQTLSGPQIVAGDAVMNHIAQIAIVEKSITKMLNQDMLIIHDYLRDGNKIFAERYPQSAVTLTSNGGEGGNPIASEISIQFGGIRQVGSAAKDATTGAITFTPDAGG